MGPAGDPAQYDGFGPYPYSVLEDDRTREEVKRGPGMVVAASEQEASLRECNALSDRDPGEVVDPNAFPDPTMVSDLQFPGKFDVDGRFDHDSFADPCPESLQQGHLYPGRDIVSVLKEEDIREIPDRLFETRSSDLDTCPV
jgi:hypothetical protein